MQNFGKVCRILDSSVASASNMQNQAEKCFPPSGKHPLPWARVAALCFLSCDFQVALHLHSNQKKKSTISFSIHLWLISIIDRPSSSFSKMQIYWNTCHQCVESLHLIWLLSKSRQSFPATLLPFIWLSWGREVSTLTSSSSSFTLRLKNTCAANAVSLSPFTSFLLPSVFNFRSVSNAWN